MKVFLTFLIFSCATVAVLGQPINNGKITVKRLKGKIDVDGKLDEEVWQKADRSGDFWLYFPNDSTSANAQTDVRMLYDDNFLYIAIDMAHPSMDYVVPTLKRDFRAGGNDNVTLLFDTFSDGQNAFMFGMNPSGVQREGLISGGGTNLDGFTTSWDNKWYSDATIYDKGWICEWKIPLSILRYNNGSKSWRFNLYRFDMETNERSTWTRIPRNQWIFHLGYMGEMEFEQSLEKGASGISLIPYSIAGQSVDKEAEDGIKRKNKFNIGGDAKIPITSGLNLDITANPDFSQVEVDRQVANIDRFEIFFPERRQFFLENEDLFGSFGFNNINPFFSRRIGISVDTTSGTIVQNTIYGGARLSGKINNKLRVGILNMQTAEDLGSGQPSLNFGVSSLQYRVGAKSNIAAVFVNRQAFNQINGQSIDNFNRLIGLDYNLVSSDNVWNGKLFLHRSISESTKRNPYAHGFSLNRVKKNFILSYQHEYVGEGFDAQTGFVRRNDYIGINPDVTYILLPNNSKVNRHNIGIRSNTIWKPSIGITDQVYSPYWEMEYTNNDRFELKGTYNYLYLFDDFDPTGTSATPLKDGTDYKFTNVEALYRSNNALRFNFSSKVLAGQYFNGTRLGISGDFAYRFEPIVQLGINYAYNIFDMPYLEANRYNLLLGPSVDVSLSRDLFFATFVQYNSQSKNTNINARFQWRFAPVSDFFLVYINNYATGNDALDRFAVKERNRSIVAKVTYWLNT